MNHCFREWMRRGKWHLQLILATVLMMNDEDEFWRLTLEGEDASEYTGSRGVLARGKSNTQLPKNKNRQDIDIVIN
jgi:hypothetical protein